MTNAVLDPSLYYKLKEDEFIGASGSHMGNIIEMELLNGKKEGADLEKCKTTDNE